jgi:hypothetical protein
MEELGGLDTEEDQLAIRAAVCLFSDYRPSSLIRWTMRFWRHAPANTMFTLTATAPLSTRSARLWRNWDV